LERSPQNLFSIKGLRDNLNPFAGDDD